MGVASLDEAERLDVPAGTPLCVSSAYGS